MNSSLNHFAAASHRQDLLLAAQAHEAGRDIRRARFTKLARVFSHRSPGLTAAPVRVRPVAQGAQSAS